MARHIGSGSPEGSAPSKPCGLQTAVRWGPLCLTPKRDIQVTKSSHSSQGLTLKSKQRGTHHKHHCNHSVVIHIYGEDWTYHNWGPSLPNKMSCLLKESIYNLWIFHLTPLAVQTFILIFYHEIVVETHFCVILTCRRKENRTLNLLPLGFSFRSLSTFVRHRIEGKHTGEKTIGKHSFISNLQCFDLWRPPLIESIAASFSFRSLITLKYLLLTALKENTLG